MEISTKAPPTLVEKHFMVQKWSTYHEKNSVWYWSRSSGKMAPRESFEAELFISGKKTPTPRKNGEKNKFVLKCF